MTAWCFKTGGPCTEEVQFKRRQVFAAFPFQDDYYSLFDEVVKPCIEGLRNRYGRYGLKLVDARSQTRTRDFMCSIVEGIRSSQFSIVDLSLQNVNVYLELGIMIGRGLEGQRRPFVLISNFEEHLSADISSVNVVRYDWKNLTPFANKLEETCLETFKAVAPKAPPPTATPVNSPLASLDRYDSLVGGGYFRRGGLSLPDDFGVSKSPPSLADLARRLSPPS